MRHRGTISKVHFAYKPKDIEFVSTVTAYWGLSKGLRTVRTHDGDDCKHI